MEILLNSSDSKRAGNLKKLYQKAITEAEELFVLSAYLTDWDMDIPLNKSCQEVSFIVGTDFGITRKKACQKVLKWLPGEFKNDFLAVDRLSGFHPKLVMWKKNSGEYFIIVGSSNLTQAAFNTNFEANIFTSISDNDYHCIREWIYKIRLETSPINEDWLSEYKERKPTGTGVKKKSKGIIFLELPVEKNMQDYIAERRRNQREFKKIEKDLLNIFEECASGSISNIQFYDQMMELWGKSDARFQGKGFEILGKHTNWKIVCESVNKILNYSHNASIIALDNLVKREIDKLAQKGHHARRAWMSEMLCHFFPNRYPIVNKPVYNWLRSNKYRFPRKSSEGAKYIDLATKLRLALMDNKKYPAKNLAELDTVIWYWNHLREEAKKQKQ